MLNFPSPLRQYQFVISKAALFDNTLVCIPTGLGKTFIAAVVIYNYYRWFPKGIIVFAAPTRALVFQQMKACYNFLDIPQNDCLDLTGRIAPAKRKGMWKEHRIFFVSPQTFNSDLGRSHVPRQVSIMFELYVM